MYVTVDKLTACNEVVAIEIHNVPINDQVLIELADGPSVVIPSTDGVAFAVWRHIDPAATPGEATFWIWREVRAKPPEWDSWYAGVAGAYWTSWFERETSAVIQVCR